MVSLLLAASITLTSCSNGGNTSAAVASSAAANNAVSSTRTDDTESKDVESGLSEKSTEVQITQVKDAEYTTSRGTGYYTGSWKGDRPEGTGEYFISDDIWYKGEWANGALCGEGEYSRYTDDGLKETYKGMCFYNSPHGEGVLTVSDDEHTVITEGDFSDMDSLIIYIINKSEDRLADIGRYRNGDFVSLSEMEDIDGMRFLYDPFLSDPDITMIEVKDEWKEPGTYVGQTKNGVPDGYGYFRYEYYDSARFGFWKDGHIAGRYTYVWDSSRMKNNGVEVGEYTEEGKETGELTTYLQDLKGFHITKKDISNQLTIGDDGLKRYGFEEYQDFRNDGTYAFYKSNKYKDDNDPTISMLQNHKEGSYCEYNKNGNIIDYGIYIEGEGWVSQHPSKKVKDTLIKVATVLGVALVIYGTYKFLSSGTSSLEERCRANSAAMVQRCKEYNDNKQQAYELRREADEAAFRGDTVYADSLYSQANDVDPTTGILW